MSTRHFLCGKNNMKNVPGIPSVTAYLGCALDDEKYFLVGPSLLVEIVTLEHHAPLRNVHEAQEVHGAKLDRHENLSVNPRLLRPAIVARESENGERWLSGRCAVYFVLELK